MEKESHYVPKKVGFEQKITDRMAMWFTLVEDSDLDDETKKLLNNRLIMLQEFKKHHWDVGEACYNTIVNIGNVTRGKGGEARVLFENLRDDIWDFYEEI